MRAFPVPSGGLYFPDYFIDGRDAFLDTSLNWWTGVTLGGNSLPSQYCAFDSSTALHCVTTSNSNLTHLLSWDGGETWQNQSYDLSMEATGLEEWEFHSNGVHDLFVLNVRYQSSSGPDVDIAWHVRDFSESMVQTQGHISGRAILTPHQEQEMISDLTSLVWGSFQMVAHS